MKACEKIGKLFLSLNNVTNNMTNIKLGWNLGIKRDPLPNDNFLLIWFVCAYVTQFNRSDIPYKNGTVHKTQESWKKISSILDWGYNRLDWKNATALWSRVSTIDNGIAHLYSSLKVTEMGENHISEGKAKAGM